MSSLGGSASSGNRSRSAATVWVVSSTDSVVCDSQATLAGSRTCTAAPASGPSTRWMCAGASPVVPMTSSWPSWPMSRMSYPWAANRRASLCTLVTSGQVASIVRRLAALGLSADLRRHPVRREHHHRPPVHLRRLVHEYRAALLQRGHDVLVVHDLLAHVDRGAVALQRQLHGLHGPVHPGAVPPGLGEQHPPGHPLGDGLPLPV